MATAPYDEIADWYEHTFLGGEQARFGMPGTDSLGIDRSLRELLGKAPGTMSDNGPGNELDVCLEIGCGTGVHGATVRELGWTPIGIDISAGMLGHVGSRLVVARGDAEHLPFAGASAGAVIAVMVHTDMPGYSTVVGEAARVLRPGGVFVHVGVHPCFCGGFADRGDPTAIVIRPGYGDGHWTKESWTNNGVRDKVGASHMPVPELLHAFLDAGLALERFTEGGQPTPIVLGIRARKAG